MDDYDLDALRQYRSTDAHPPLGMRERIEEDLLAVIDAETARLDAGGRRIHSTPRAPRRSWFSGLLRPAMAAGATAAIAVVVAVWSNGGTGGTTTAPTTGVQQAGTSILEATAARLFGTEAANAAPIPPVSGTISATESVNDIIAAGPTHSSDGTRMSDQTSEFVRELSTNPREVSDVMQAAAGAAVDDDLVDRTSFHLTMRWVVDGTIPVTVRSTMLNSLGGLDGIDQAVTGADVLGRAGVVVSHYDPRFGIREQYVLTETGELLERRSFTAGPIDPACPEGIYTIHELYGDGVRIERSQMSWLSWPQVIPSCDPAMNAAAR